MRLQIPFADRKRAGSRRARTAIDLAGFLAEMDPDELARALGLLSRPRIAGAAQEIATTIVNTPLTTVQATIVGPILAVPQDPLVLAVGYVPNITGVAAAANATLNLLRNDTNAVFSSGVFTNNGAGAGAVGGPDIIGLVPFGIPAGSGVLLQGAVSTGTGTAVGAPTTPSILALLGSA